MSIFLFGVVEESILMHDTSIILRLAVSNKIKNIKKKHIYHIYTFIKYTI